MATGPQQHNNTQQFIRDVEEDIRQEVFLNRFKRALPPFIIACIVIIIVVVGGSIIQQRHISQSQKNGSAFDAILSQMQQGSVNSQIQPLEKLSKSKDEAYVFSANLLLAQQALKDGDITKATTYYNNILESKLPVAYKNLALLSVAQLNMDTPAYQNYVSKLQKLADGSSSFHWLALELISLKNIQENKIKEARHNFQLILDSNDADSSLKFRARLFLQILNAQNTASQNPPSTTLQEKG